MNCECPASVHKLLIFMWTNPVTQVRWIRKVFLDLFLKHLRHVSSIRVCLNFSALHTIRMNEVIYSLLYFHATKEISGIQRTCDSSTNVKIDCADKGREFRKNIQNYIRKILPLISNGHHFPFSQTVSWGLQLNINIQSLILTRELTNFMVVYSVITKSSLWSAVT